MSDFLETLKMYAKAGVEPSSLQELSEYDLKTLLKSARDDRSPLARQVENWLEGETGFRSGDTDGALDPAGTLDGFFDDTRVHATLTEPQPAVHVLRNEITEKLSNVLPGDRIVFQKATVLGTHTPVENIVVHAIDKVSGEITGRSLSGRVEKLGRETPLLQLDVQANSTYSPVYRDPTRMGGFGSTLDSSREFTV